MEIMGIQEVLGFLEFLDIQKVPHILGVLGFLEVWGIQAVQGIMKAMGIRCGLDILHSQKGL